MSTDDVDVLQHLRRQLLIASGLFVYAITTAAALYASPDYWEQPYHTSALSGQQWVEELMQGHPDRIKNELGMRAHVFLLLIAALQSTTSLKASRHVTIEEKVAIFLYTCVTGLSVPHVGERFQHSNETISKYFKQVLVCVSSPQFYSTCVKFPTPDTPTPPFIKNNPRFSPFFDGAVGVIDGTHFACSPTAEEQQLLRDRNEFISQNCLVACDWNLRFIYFVSGWEAASSDAQMFRDAHSRDLFLPPGKFLIGDTGFEACSTLLVPYRGVRYHMAEGDHAEVRPSTPQELFNLRHSSTMNVIGRIFGVLKKRFTILTYAQPLPINDHARIPPALAAIHNFILEHDPDDIQESLVDLDKVIYDLDDPLPGWTPEHDHDPFASQLET